jgi:hypothetical protein
MRAFDSSDAAQTALKEEIQLYEQGIAEAKRAIAKFEQALKLYRQAGDNRGQAFSLLGLGSTLFTDATAKDDPLADQVNALASSIGATIATRSSLAGSGGSVDTFRLAFGDDGSSHTKLNNLRRDPTLIPLSHLCHPTIPSLLTRRLHKFKYL